jgi:transposase-like protein|tara:strand:+ start:820 stop:1008 length:189 start_codon:yes stop_codon:yes gene_type:complete
LVVEDKVSCREAAQRLSLVPSTLAYWVEAYKEGKLGDVGKAQTPLIEVEMELARAEHGLLPI